MLLSQLIDADELQGLSPEELREMILKLDDEVVYGSETVDAAVVSDPSVDRAPAPAKD